MGTVQSSLKQKRCVYSLFRASKLCKRKIAMILAILVMFLTTHLF